MVEKPKAETPSNLAIMGAGILVPNLPVHSRAARRRR